MAVEFVAPEMEPPYRLLLLGGASEGWYAASDEERRDIILPRLVEVCRSWSEFGAKLITSLDDDLFTVGKPKTTAISWYLVYEVDSADIASKMIHSFRVSKDGARLDKWFHLDARICRPFFRLRAERGCWGCSA